MPSSATRRRRRTRGSTSRCCARGARGAQVEALLGDYHTLRAVEARARWLAGRGVDVLDAQAIGPVAELVEPGLDAAGLAGRLDAARTRIRAGFDAVVKAGTIEALEG